MVRLDHPSNVYGWSVHRRWWKPWRYNLHLCYMGERVSNGYLTDVHDELYVDLTLDGVKGMLKLLELWKD